MQANENELSGKVIPPQLIRTLMTAIMLNERRTSGVIDLGLMFESKTRNNTDILSRGTRNKNQFHNANKLSLSFLFV